MPSDRDALASNSSSNNSWNEELSAFFIIYRPWEIAFCTSLLTFGFIANLMLLVAQWKDPLHCFGNISTCFVQHIAVIDCLGLLVSSPVLFSAIKNNRPFYVGSNHGKQFKPYILFVTMLTNFGFTSFAVERFLSVAKPFFHKVCLTKRRVRISFGVMWIFALNCVLIDRCLYQKTQDVPLLSYVVETSVSLPCLATTLSLYFACYISIKRQQRQFQQDRLGDVTQNALRVKLSHEKRFLITLFIAGSVIIVLWMPSFIIMLPLRLQENTSKEFYRLYLILIPCMATMHASVNPIIYNLRLPKYRKTFQRLYCSFCARVRGQ